MVNKVSVVTLSVVTALATGCASTPKYPYGASAGANQEVVQAASGQATLPRLVSKQKNIVMAEPRAAICDDQTEFAFNVVFANKQNHPVEISPANFKVLYDGRTFPAMSEKEVEKSVHSGDWLKNSMLLLGVVGGIAGAASGNLGAGQSLLMQGASNYSTIDAEQNADMEKYRNKVLGTKAVDPKAAYGGLIVARHDDAGHDYSFQSSKMSSDIQLLVEADGETDTLNFNCHGESALTAAK